MSKRAKLFLGVWFVGAMVAAGVAYALPSSSTAIQQNQNGFTTVSGWCFTAGTGDGAVNRFTTGAPSWLDSATLGQVRWVNVQHADNTNSEIPICVELGSVGRTPTCDATASTPSLIWNKGDSVRMLVRSTLQSGATAGAAPALKVLSSAETVVTCVTVGF